MADDSGDIPVLTGGELALADTVILLRFFEFRGEIRKAVSVLKRRMGKHATDIRELTLSGKGVSIGPRLAMMEGVLSGIPQIVSGDA